MFIKLIEFIVIIVYLSMGFIFAHLKKNRKFENIEAMGIISTLITCFITFYLVMKYSMIVAFFVQIVWLLTFNLGGMYYLLQNCGHINSFREFLDYKSWKVKFKEEMEKKVVNKR